ncbi:LysR family transcriptional regulator [Methylobacterium sp. C1]|uniref:LysR family transcriptional regulator n=1 Tax=Methylobacterium sp. C1 TaxID=1479019 RepID=UPI0013319493|nr:LysR family transcriptional regulator [Methylobacterium sp. C1]
MADRDIGALVASDHIKLLLAISKWHSFSRAAVELGITQSSISQQVKRLERLAGFPLFRRNGRGIDLTSECETVIFYARAMERLTEDMRRHFDQGRTSGKVSIGMGEDFCRTALPAVLGLLAHNFATVDVRIVSGSYDLLAQAIAARSLDLVVMRRWDRFPDTKLLWTDSSVWYGHPYFATRVEDPVPLVVPLAPNPMRTAIIDALNAAERPWKVMFESSGIAGIESALRCRLGVVGGPSSMPHQHVPVLGPESGLPSLPDVDFVMYGPSKSAKGVVHAVAEVLEHLADTRFQTPYSGDEPRARDA